MIGAKFKEQAKNQNASIWLEMKKVYFNAQFHIVIIWDFQVNVAVVSTFKNKHGWFYYFDVKPDLKLSRTNVRQQGKGSILLEKSHRTQTSTIPSFTQDTPFGHETVNWLQSMAGGGKSKCLANQVLSKSLKYIRFCSEDFLDEEVTESNIDYCLGSTSHVYRFFDYLEKDFDVSASGQIGYINALLDVMDFRKFKGLTLCKIFLLSKFI